MALHRYRSHNCNELTRANVGEEVRLSGWVHKKRDHGNLLFVDLRDHYGITQCVVDTSSPVFAQIERIGNESVITVTGKVSKRTPDTVNANIPTGEVELRFYAPAGTDNQVPHDRDELYFVVHGNGTFERESERAQFTRGDVLFAAAGEHHRFTDFSPDLTLWVLFYGPKRG